MGPSMKSLSWYACVIPWPNLSCKFVKILGQVSWMPAKGIGGNRLFKHAHQDTKMLQVPHLQQILLETS